jgi:hypothetical protein
MALEFVDIREVWDVIRPGLELIQSETNPDWRVEDVYASCVNKHSFLLMDTARTASGFTVVETKSHPFRDKTIMLVWIAYDPVPNSVPTYQSQLEALALQTGHSEIQVMTPHRGLWKSAESAGYTMRWAMLSKKLEGDTCHSAAAAIPGSGNQEVREL